MRLRKKELSLITFVLLVLISSLVYAQIENFSDDTKYEISISPATINPGGSAQISITAINADGSPAAGKQLFLSASLGTFSDQNPVTGNTGTASSVFYPDNTMTSTISVTILVHDSAGNLVYSQTITIIANTLSGSTPPTVTPTISPDQQRDNEPQPLTTQNTCPLTNYVQILPNPIYRTSGIYAQAFGFDDPDGDGASFHFRWTINGAEVFTEDVNTPVSHLPAQAMLRKSDLIGVSVEPSDGNCRGRPVSSSIVVQDSPPVITATHDSDQSNPKISGDPVNFVVSVTDPDGDEIPSLLVDYGDGERETFVQTPVLQALASGECSDRSDNDRNGMADFPYDPGCTGINDNDESMPSVLPQCSDRQDSDGDFIFDFPYEPGCESASDNDETNPVPAGECYDFTDNDQDGLIDFPNDPGCIGAGSNSEADRAVLPECYDFTDNDQDGNTDFGSDVQCFSASDKFEASSQSECHNFVDDDADARTDYPDDTDCINVFDDSETGGAASNIECSDSLDNDGNGFTDYPDDPGCLSPTDILEGPTALIYECSDGTDNDGDSTYDFRSVNPSTPDADCVSASDDDESSTTAVISSTASFTFSHAYITSFNATTFAANISVGPASLTTYVYIINPAITPVGCPEVQNLDAELNDDISSVDLSWSLPTAGPVDALRVCYVNYINRSTDIGQYSPQFEAACNANGILLSPSATSYTDYAADTVDERYYKIQSLCDGTVPPPTKPCTPDTLLGDLDGDGDVDIIDAFLSAKASVGLLVFQGYDCCADPNQDGIILDILDSLTIAQLAASGTTAGTCRNPLPPPGRCATDNDCAAGQRCSIPSGSTYGLCVDAPRECSSTDILGDTDGDGDVDVLDSLKIAQYSIGLFTLQNPCCYNADATNVVGSVQDSLAASQIAAGLLRATGTCDNPSVPVRLCDSNNDCLSGEICSNEICISGTAPPSDCLRGDTDGDDDVDVIDSLRLARISVGLIDDPEDCCADANGDGRISVLDSLYASQRAVGLVPQLGRCNETVSPGSCAGDTDCATGERCNNNNCEVINPMLSGCTENSLLGDVDTSGRVDVLDSLHLSRISVGTETIDGDDCCADANNDGIVSVLDALYTAKIAVGSEQQLGTCDNPIQRPSPLPGTGLGFASITGAQVTTPAPSITPASPSLPSHSLDKKLTNDTVGKFEIEMYATDEVYNEISVPLLSSETYPKSLGTGRGTGNSNSLVMAGFTMCDAQDFAGSYDEVRGLNSSRFSDVINLGGTAQEAISESSLAYDPTVMCQVYSQGELMTLQSIAPSNMYHLKITSDDTLINVGKILPSVNIPTYSTDMNNWIGYTLLYTEVIEDALANPLTAIGFFSGFDRIQYFDAGQYLISRASGRSMTQSYADANKDFVPGIPSTNNTVLSYFSPGEGYRFNMIRDDNFEFKHGKTR